MASEYPVRIEVVGWPLAAALGSGCPWTEAVRSAVAEAGVEPLTAPVIGVEIEFRLAAVDSAGEAWDLEDLVMRTLEGLEEAVGARRVLGSPVHGNGWVNGPTAVIRDVRDGEVPGATIDVWPLGPGSEETPSGIPLENGDDVFSPAPGPTHVLALFAFTDDRALASSGAIGSIVFTPAQPGRQPGLEELRRTRIWDDDFSQVREQLSEALRERGAEALAELLVHPAWDVVEPVWRVRDFGGFAGAAELIAEAKTWDHDLLAHVMGLELAGPISDALAIMVPLPGDRLMGGLQEAVEAVGVVFAFMTGHAIVACASVKALAYDKSVEFIAGQVLHALSPPEAISGHGAVD